MTAPPKLLLDEMLSGDIAKQLRAKGHDVVAVVEEPTSIGLPDEELLLQASSSGRCLVTANVRDFAAARQLPQPGDELYLQRSAR